MGKYSYTFDPKSAMEQILADWAPKPEDARRKEPATEKEYERSLVDFLRANLEKIQVVPQSGMGITPLITKWT